MTLYLSRLFLNKHIPDIQKIFADVNRLHQTVLKGYPFEGDPTLAARLNVLFRAENVTDQPHLIRLLVQSAIPPDWTALPTYFLAQSPDQSANPSIRRIDQEYAKLELHTRLNFRLCASPTYRKARGHPTLAEKRIPLRRPDEQLDWLTRKGLQHGFALIEATTTPHVIYGKKGKQNLTFHAVTFQGQLQITELELFQSALRNGIGNAKRFGYGLLSIAN